MDVPPITLLIAFDGSAGAAAAVRAAATLFPGGRAVVLTAYTVPQITARAAGAAAPIGVDAERFVALARAAEEHAAATAAEGAALASAAQLAAEPQTSSGGESVPEAVLTAARSVDADVVVCGSRGMGGFSRAMLGSTSASLLRHADHPLLIVPEGAGGGSGPVVIGYDGSDGARAAIEAAGRLFAGRRAIVVSVWESPVRNTLTGKALLRGPLEEVREITADFDEGYEEAAGEMAAEGAALAREHGLAGEPLAVEGPGPGWRGLLGAARSAEASVIIAGSRGRGGVTSALLGSVSAGLVHNADLPVLVARG